MTVRSLILSAHGIQKLVKKHNGIDTEEHAVNGLKFNGGIMKIDHLHQRSAAQIAGAELGTLLGSGKGVVSVAHGKEQGIAFMFNELEKCVVDGGDLLLA